MPVTPGGRLEKKCLSNRGSLRWSAYHKHGFLFVPREAHCISTYGIQRPKIRRRTRRDPAGA
jgi:hypothetical protein